MVKNEHVRKWVKEQLARNTWNNLEDAALFILDRLADPSCPGSGEVLKYISTERDIKNTLESVFKAINSDLPPHTRKMVVESSLRRFTQQVDDMIKSVKS